MLAKDHAVIDTHTHMCLERMRPLGSCLVTFPDSFTAQEGWIEREEEEKRDCGGKQWAASFFFFSLRQDLSQHQILSVSAVRAPPHSTLCLGMRIVALQETRQRESSWRIISIGQSCLLLLVWNQFMLDLSVVGHWTWISTKGRHYTTLKCDKPSNALYLCFSIFKLDHFK